MHLTVSELRSRWPELSERLLATFHARQLPLPTAPGAPPTADPAGDRIDVASLPDSALRALCTARGLHCSGDHDSLLAHLRPTTAGAPPGHFDFSLPTTPQLRALLSALGAASDGNSTALAHRAALTWARRGSFLPPDNTPAVAGAPTPAAPAAAPGAVATPTATIAPALAPVVRPAHVVRNADGTWRRPRGAARKNCSWNAIRGAWVPSLPH